jgi:hypothetical protein
MKARHGTEGQAMIRLWANESKLMKVSQAHHCLELESFLFHLNQEVRASSQGSSLSVGVTQELTGFQQRRWTKIVEFSHGRPPTTSVSIFWVGG